MAGVGEGQGKDVALHRIHVVCVVDGGLILMVVVFLNEGLVVV